MKKFGRSISQSPIRVSTPIQPHNSISLVWSKKQTNVFTKLDEFIFINSIILKAKEPIIIYIITNRGYYYLQFNLTFKKFTITCLPRCSFARHVSNWAAQAVANKYLLLTSSASRRSMVLYLYYCVYIVLYYPSPHHKMKLNKYIRKTK